MKSLYRAIYVAAMCLHVEPSTRPLISDVVSALEYITEDKNHDGDGDGDGENSVKAAGTQQEEEQ